MGSKKKIWITFLGIITIAPCVAQYASVLSEGAWGKFSVTQEGIYKITIDQLKSAGIDPANVDPRKLRLFTGYIGMLPQANNKSRINDLQEVAIQVVGEDDGKFDASDYIVFYGLGPDKFSYSVSKGMFAYENNLFTDKNFYFLTAGTSNGKRITQSSNQSGTFPLVDVYDDFAFYESEKYNLLKSGRQWFGEQFDASLEAAIRFQIEGIQDNSLIKMTSHVMAQSISPCAFRVLFNSNVLLNQSIDPIPNTAYTERGKIKIDTVTFNSALVGASSQSAQEIKYQFTKGSSGLSVGYLDYFLFSFRRRLALYGDQSFFMSTTSLNQPVSTFKVLATDPVQVWEVTDMFNVKSQVINKDVSSLNFSVSTETLKRFAVFNLSKIKAAVPEPKIKNQNLHGLTAPDMLVVTTPALQAEAQRLAAHRSTHDGLRVQVTTIDEVYNEYSGGKQDFTAIRDFVRDLYLQPNSKLKFVLLFGRGSYDYKSRIPNNSNLIPIYESRNSLSPLETYSSDDYYGFLESEEGEWEESPAQNHTLDVAVGRIPAKTTAEAGIIVDKLISYDVGKNRFGDWCGRFLFVADDGDFNIHQSQADQLAGTIEFAHPEVNPTRFFLDNYEQLQRASGPYSPDAYKSLNLAVKKGAAIVNYTGHGSEEQWMQERVLDSDLIKSFRNAPYYPLFVTATCEFGRNDDPLLISSGEKTLLQSGGGSIGIVTTARPVQSSTNFLLNEAFYAALFTKDNGRFRTLGAIFKDTKNSSTFGVNNRNFALLGDPSMKLALPDNQIEISEAKTSTGSTQLKGYSRVTVKGDIIKNGSRLTSYNGNLTAALLDKPVNFITKGNESAPYSYSERASRLFQGEASVANGQFQFEFVMPSDIGSAPELGKFSLYAHNDQEDAMGYSLSSMVGGIESNPSPDVDGPKIRLFLGDTTFRSGGTTGSNTELIVKLADASGINLTTTNMATTMTAQMDNASMHSLSAYYYADKDNASKGTVNYPLIDLEKGTHTITVAATDTYGNKTTEKIDFNVIEGDQLVIQDFENFPNPFSSTTTFMFTHTRPGDDLEAELSIYNLTGQLAVRQKFEIPFSQYKIKLTEWDGLQDGIKLQQGVYLARLSVRSLTNGLKTEKIAQLILLN